MTITDKKAESELERMAIGHNKLTDVVLMRRQDFSVHKYILTVTNNQMRRNYLHSFYQKKKEELK